MKIEWLAPAPVDIDVAWLLNKEKMGEICGPFPDRLDGRSNIPLLRATLQSHKFRLANRAWRYLPEWRTDGNTRPGREKTHGRLK
jgi:hypothetical protein